MNLGLAAATFAVVIPAELPDKTFVSTVVLSSRHRPLPVWSGAAAGLVVQAGVAAVAGRLLALAPHRVVAAIVAGLFVAGAAYLFLPEAPPSNAAAVRSHRTRSAGSRRATATSRPGPGDTVSPGGGSPR